jgi:hypothetical protein
MSQLPAPPLLENFANTMRDSVLPAKPFRLTTRLCQPPMSGWAFAYAVTPLSRKHQERATRVGQPLRRMDRKGGPVPNRLSGMDGKGGSAPILYSHPPVEQRDRWGTRLLVISCSSKRSEQRINCLAG